MDRLTDKKSILTTIGKAIKNVGLFKDIVLKLAKYEDTELEPEEISQNINELKLARKTIRDLRLTIEDLNKDWRPILYELPKEDGEYLVTLKHKEFNQTQVKIMDYYCNGYFTFDNSLDEFWWEVVAWQPSPNPFKK